MEEDDKCLFYCQRSAGYKEILSNSYLTDDVAASTLASLGNSNVFDGPLFSPVTKTHYHVPMLMAAPKQLAPAKKNRIQLHLNAAFSCMLKQLKD